MTKLVLEYVTGGSGLPNILATLKRTRFGGNRHFTIVAVHLLEGDEATWCLERSWIPANVEQQGREQLVH